MGGKAGERRQGGERRQVGGEKWERPDQGMCFASSRCTQPHTHTHTRQLCFNPHLELFIVVVLLPLLFNAVQV